MASAPLPMLIAAAVALVSTAILLVIVVRRYLRLRGTRIVTCPETQSPAAVEIDMPLATWSAALWEPAFQISDCSRWPAERRCGRACLRQIEDAPEECLVRTMVTRWYVDRACAVCGQPIPPVRWYERKPALLAPDSQPVEWAAVALERLPETLKTHQPLCWNCVVVETFRRKYPDLVIDRPSFPKPTEPAPGPVEKV